MTGTATFIDCACGTLMTPINGAHMCENCDTAQPQEREIDPRTKKPKPRIITPADRRFHLTWEARKRQYYGHA